MPLFNPTLLAPIAKANLTETPHILAKHANHGATSASVLLTEANYPSALDPTECPSFPRTTIRVVPTDSLSAAIAILTAPHTDDNVPLPRGKTVVLNSCSDKAPGGRYAALVHSQTGGGSKSTTSSSTTTTSSGNGIGGVKLPHDSANITQEESLCLATTLYTTLNPSWYPWPNVGPDCVRGTYSPGVVILRDPQTFLPLPAHPSTTDPSSSSTDLSSERHILSILSLSPPSHRPLDPTGTTFSDPLDLEYLRRKLRFWLRTAATNGMERLVLGAWGCGAANGCPRRLVAGEMRRVLEEEEFRGWFWEVVVAITPREGEVGLEKGTAGEGSYSVFREVLDGVVV